MALRFFVVPVLDSLASEQELNGFIANHKVLSIEKKLIEAGVNSFWAICVDFLNTPSGGPTGFSNLSRNRIDYKTVLTPDEFEVFSRLRQLRKEMAQAEAVPVYALFTHTELNRRSKRRWRSRVWVLQRAKRLGLISESNLQTRLTALTAFSKSAGVHSWRFRNAMLQHISVNDP